MTSVKRIINRFISSYQPVQLGRWSIEYCPKILDNRVKLTNEDHCGTCGTNTDTTNVCTPNMYKINNQNNYKNNYKLITTDKYLEMNMMSSFNLADI